MFKHLTPEEQVRKLQQENRALKEHVKVLEDAIVELAAIISEEEEEGEDG
jgi:archaellum component FlaC